MGRPIIQMASAFGEQERQIVRRRVNAGLERVRVQGTKPVIRKRVSPKIEDAIRSHLSAGNGILKVAALVGVGSGTVQRVKKRDVEAFGRGGVISAIVPIILVQWSHRGSFSHAYPKAKSVPTR